MHLFGDSSGPHLVHFHAHREHEHAELEWEVRNAPTLSWRVLRSESDFAETADALPGSGQTVVMEGSETHTTDNNLAESTPYFYTVFAQDQQGAWHLQVKTKLGHQDRLRWHHPSVGKGPHEADAGKDNYEEGGVLQGELNKSLLLRSSWPLFPR